MTRHLDTTEVQIQRLLRGRREVAIGARAVRRRWLRILSAVAGVALISISLWLYLRLTALTGPSTNPAATVTVRCVQCQRDATVTIPAGDTSRVVECPHCHARAAYKLWQCRSCNERFLPPSPRTGDIMTCPKCGGTQVGTAEP